MTQLSLFGDDAFHDPRPVPLRAASAFDFDLQTCEAEGGAVYYAIQDWVRGIAGKQDVRNIIVKLKKRAPELLPSWLQLPYTAANGKTYQMDYADAEGLYAISQRMDASNDQRNAVLAYLAKAGVKFDEYRAAPEQMIAEGHSYLDAKAKRLGWSTDHKALRRESADARVLMTDAAKDAVAAVLTGRDYVTLTNTEYRELYGRSTAELRAAMGLPQGTNLRDFQPAVALTYQQTAERIIADMLRTRVALSFDECLEIVTRVCRMIGRQIAESSELLGIDIPTGLPLLGAAS